MAFDIYSNCHIPFDMSVRCGDQIRCINRKGRGSPNVSAPARSLSFPVFAKNTPRRRRNSSPPHTPNDQERRNAMTQSLFPRIPSHAHYPTIVVLLANKSKHGEAKKIFEYWDMYVKRQNERDYPVSFCEFVERYGYENIAIH